MDPSAITVPATTGTPAWVQLVYMLAMALITMVLVPFINARRKAADAEAQSHQVDTTRGLLDQREAIVDQLKAYLFDQAGSIAEKYFPQLAADVLAGKFKTADDIKAQLRSWGTDLYDSAVAHFKGQGIDLVERFGPQFINDMIELAANRVSPFPGKDTAKAMLEGGAKAVLDAGIHGARVQMAYGPQAMLAPPASEVKA